jgi:hypothetical protein
MLFNNVLQFPGKRLEGGERRSWSVCPHLSHSDSLFDYYVASESIMLLLGKCFCHGCYESILKKRDLKEFMESCDHMTDKEFQEDFINPLFQINREVIRTKRNVNGEKTTLWTWISCSHVSKERQLESLYTSCNPIFFHGGFVTCNECLQAVPGVGFYMQTMPGCEAMTDEDLQERVFKQLYPINRGVLEAVGHYKR